MHLLVGYAAGGVSDILARLIGKQLSERLGQPFIIENRPGAWLATWRPIKSCMPRPTATRCSLAGMANAINVSLYPDSYSNFARDMAPVDDMRVKHLRDSAI